MNDKSIIYKAVGVLVRDRKLLVERAANRDVFVAPGSKVDGDETVEQALVRELMEEIQITVDPADFEPFGTFEAIAAGHDDLIVKMTVFMVKKWEGELKPAHEIAEIKWVTSSNEEHLNLGSIFEHDVIPRLKAANFID